MTEIQSFINSFYQEASNLEKIAESGSGRTNYRFKSDTESFILTKGQDVKENEAFFYLSDLFKNLNGNVPTVLEISEDKTLYIQSDLGEQSLLDIRKSTPTESISIYEKAVKKLAHLQIGAHQIVDYNKIYESKSFNKMLVNRDLFYFKNYYLDLLDISYSQAGLLDEFDKIANKVEKANYRYFMFRDFQGRNIIVSDNQPFFIDYQDGMEGPIAYDLVSLLWQAKAELKPEEKEKLYTTYTQEVAKLIPNEFNVTKFRQDYNICTLMRLMQVMGAYGKLGIIQQKPHFKESISYGVKNLKAFTNNKIMTEFPLLKSIFEKM